MRFAVTGGAGFIGSHIVDRLISDGNEVVCIDSLSTGKIENISHHLDNDRFYFIRDTLANTSMLLEAFKDVDIVYHFAANADIRGGIKDTKKDIEVNTIYTHNVLEAMRKNNIKEIVFASSSAVYGEPVEFPTSENHPLIPTSLYGASKVAGEALIEAYTHAFDFRCWIYRFVGIIGERYSHGVIYDFVHKLRKNNKVLEILGDGNQKKSFLYVKDCIDGILFGYEHSKESVNIFNLGVEDTIKIKNLADIVVEEMNLKNVEYRFTGGIRGWKGDAPIVLLSTNKINKLGWKPKYDIEESIRLTTRWLKKVITEDRYQVI